MSQHVLPGERIGAARDHSFVVLMYSAAIHAFAPSIIFVSAGFDAADGDENNYGMYERGGWA